MKTFSIVCDTQPDKIIVRPADFEMLKREFAAMAKRLDELEARDSLVQEVIAAYLALEPAWHTKSMDDSCLFERLRRLAEWKP